MQQGPIIVILLFSSLSYGAVTSVHAAATRQQALVTFHVRDPKQCTVTVFSDAAMEQKIDDTNDAVFAGSESCARPFNLINGTQVAAVLGRRTSETAADGRLHSRSLAVATTYWVKIVDQTDKTTSTTQFTTGNIPLGDTHIEDVPFNLSGYNHWAYPDLDWAGAGGLCGMTKDCIDPMSGVRFRLVQKNLIGNGGPGDHFEEEMAFAGVFPANGWANPDNIWKGISFEGDHPSGCGWTNGSARSYATYSGTNRDALFLPFPDPKCQNAEFAMQAWQVSGQQLSDVAINLYGYAAGARGDDAVVQVALCYDYDPSTGNTCGPDQEVTLPPKPGVRQVPNGYPNLQFAGWQLNRALTSEQASVPNGDATVNGTAITLTSGFLPVNASPGWKLFYNNTLATIAAVHTATSFTTVENLGNGKGKWSLAAFGVRIRKKTAAPNPISLAATWGLVWNPNTPAGPAGPDCHRKTFTVSTDANGYTYSNGFTKPARLCYVLGYLIMLADDGETRFLSELAHTPIKDSAGEPIIPRSPWKLDDPYSLSGVYWDDTGKYGTDSTAMQSLYKASYNYSDPRCRWKQQTTAANGYLRRTNPSDDVCMVWTNLTPFTSHSTLTEQIASTVHTSPIWDEKQMGSSFVSKGSNLGASGDYMMMNVLSNGQNSPCFDAVFQLSTGKLVKFFDTLVGTLPGLTYFGCHSYGMSGGTGTQYASIDPSILPHATQDPTGWLAGPYVLPIPSAKSFDGKTWTNDISLSPGKLIPYPDPKCGPNPVRPKGHYVFDPGNIVDLDASRCVDQTNVAGVCPKGYGLDGLQQCVWIEVADTHPCNATATPREASKWPCKSHPGWSNPAGQSIRKGDIAGWMGDINNVDGKHEGMKVLDILPGRTSTTATVLLKRFAQHDNLYANPQAPESPAVIWYDHLFTGPIGSTHPKSWIPWMQVSTWGFMDLSLPLSKTILKPDFITVHNNFGLGPDGKQFTTVGYGEARTCMWPECIGAPAQVHMNIDTDTFGGVTRSATAGKVEQYPNLTNWTAATPEERSLYQDVRHINPEYGSTPEDPVKIWNHQYLVVPGQKFTYRIDIYQDLGIGKYKVRPPNVFSSRGAFYDISGPGSTIDDSKPWAYCYAYKAGECVRNSAAGQLFVSAPNAHIAFGGCVTNTQKFYTPCATPLWNFAGWMIQGDTQHDDPAGTRIRRITMGLSGPAAQYEYTSPFMTPDTKMALLRANYPGGVRPDYLAIKMPPPPPPSDSIDRTNHIDTPVRVEAGPAFARVRFGYAENGASDQFYCTSRREACLADPKIKPFAFAQSDAATAQDCASGCTIHIPAISGRVLYYRVERSADGRGSWVDGELQAAVIR